MPVCNTQPGYQMWVMSGIIGVIHLACAGCSKGIVMITIFRRYRKLVAASFVALLFVSFFGSSLLFSMEQAASEVQVPDIIMQDFQSFNPHVGNVSPEHQQAFVAVTTQLGTLINAMNIDNYPQHKIEIIKKWSVQHASGSVRYDLDNALDRMIIQHKIRFFCDKVGERTALMREELKGLQRAGDKQNSELCKKALDDLQAGYGAMVAQITELASLKKTLDAWHLIHYRMISLRDAYKNVEKNPQQTALVVDKAEDLNDYLILTTTFANNPQASSVLASIRAVTTKLINTKAAYSPQLYDELNRSAGGSTLNAGFTFLGTMQKQLLQMEDALRKHMAAINLTAHECKEGARLLSLFCAFYHQTDTARRKAIGDEYSARARVACAQLTSLIKGDIAKDPEALKAAQDLKRFFEAGIDQDQERVVRVVIASVQDELDALEKNIGAAIDFFGQVPDSKHQDSYDIVQARLLCFQKTLKMFKDAYSMVKNNTMAGRAGVCSSVFWLTEFYGHFNQCISLDQANTSINRNNISTTVSTGLLWAMRATNLVTGYAREVQVLSYKKLWPVVVGENEEIAGGQLAREIQDDAQTCQLKQLYTFLSLFEADTARDMVASLGFGVKTQALLNLGKEQLGGLGRHSMLESSLKKFEMAPEFNLMTEMSQRSLKMLASALYYNIGRSYFFQTARPEGWIPTAYKPWKEAGLEMISVLKTFTKVKIGPIFDRIFTAGAIDQVGKWTCGVVSPALFDEGLSLAIDLSLTSAPVKNFLHNIVFYDDADIYRGDWHGKVRAKHPGLKDSQMRMLHVDQTMCAYLARVVGSQCGRALGRLSSTFVANMLAGLFTKIAGQKELQQKTAIEMITDVLGGVLAEDCSNLEYVLAHCHQMQGITLLSSQDIVTICNNFNQHKNRQKTIQEIAEKIPANAVGDVMAFIGSQVVPHLAMLQWTKHITETGRPVLVPACFFDV